MKFTAEAQRAQRFAETKKMENSSYLCVLCASAVNLFTVPYLETEV
jgi:hypothetical protein